MGDIREIPACHTVASAKTDSPASTIQPFNVAKPFFLKRFPFFSFVKV
jgi:hypothetical protein